MTMVSSPWPDSLSGRFRILSPGDYRQAGDHRQLLTINGTLPFNHSDYRIEGTNIHRRIVMEGLGSAAYPDDALQWFRQLDLLPSVEEPQVDPPEREELIALFDRVRFHPLSICVLVQQLKTRTAGQLEKRLEELLAADAVSPLAEEGTPRSLIAPLELSLERLSEAERHAVRRLGVFQGGAMEPDLLAITELGESDPDSSRSRKTSDARTLVSSATENLWPGLRRSLEAAALIEAESVPGVRPPFLRFHPTLAPMLWAGLDAADRDALTLAHRRRYHALAGYLYLEDEKNPHQARAIVSVANCPTCSAPSARPWTPAIPTPSSL